MPPRTSFLLPLTLLLVATGCAHQTVVETDPPGAEVFVNGEKVGHAPVAFEDERGWSRAYELTLRKDGYELYQTTVTQETFHWPVLGLAGACGLCTCGAAALYLVPRSRQLEDRYRFVLRRKTPLPPLAPPAAEPPPPPAAPADDAPPAPVVPMRHRSETTGGLFRY